MQINQTMKKSSPAQQTEPIVIVCAADDNYAMPLTVTIRSALENLSSDRKILLFVIDDGIQSRNKHRITKSLNPGKCEIRWISRPEALSKQGMLSDQLPSLQSLSNATWYRLLIPELLSTEFDKAIYLDCDLVVKEDLSKLWDMQIGGKYLLAACTKFVHYVSHDRGLINWQELGFSKDDKYLSAGVLVLNLEKWRSEDLCTKALSYIQQNSQYIRWHDNDVLVAIVRDQWGELDLRWNSTEARSMTQEEVDDACILHYTSPEKPWSVPQQNPATDLFFHYLKMTDWKGYRQNLSQRLWRRLKREIKRLQQTYFSK